MIEFSVAIVVLLGSILPLVGVVLVVPEAAAGAIWAGLISAAMEQIIFPRISFDQIIDVSVDKAGRPGCLACVCMEGGQEGRTYFAEAAEGSVELLRDATDVAWISGGAQKRADILRGGIFDQEMPCGWSLKLQTENITTGEIVDRKISDQTTFICLGDAPAGPACGVFVYVDYSRVSDCGSSEWG